MRKILLGVLLLIPCRSWASCANTNISNGWTCVISNVSSLGANGGSTTGINTTGSTVLLYFDAEYAGQGSATTNCTPSDTIGGSASGNTWSVVKQFTDAGAVARVTIWRVTSPSTPNVGATHVVSCTNTGITAAGALFGYTRTGSVNTDQSSGASIATNTQTGQPGSITPTNSNALIVTMAVQATAAATISSIDSSFTIVENLATAASVNMGLGVAHVTQASAAAINPTITLTVSPVLNWATSQASFVPPAVAGGLNSQFMLIGVGR